MSEPTTIYNMNAEQLTYASEVEEFFWEDSDISVPEGTPVGVEIDTPAGMELILFNNIYWTPDNLS